MNFFKMFLAMAVIAAVISCQKTGPTIGIVKVINKSGAIVSGVLVIFSCNSNTSSGVKTECFILETSKSGNKELSGVSDANGQVSFEFKYPSVLKIRAAIKTSGTDSLKGEGYIKLLEHETVTQNLTIL